MSSTIKQITEEAEIDAKRLFLPITIEVKCPECNGVLEFMGDQYLSYPILNRFEDTYATCEACDKAATLPVRLLISVEYNEGDVILEE